MQGAWGDDKCTHSLDRNPGSKRTVEKLRHVSQDNAKCILRMCGVGRIRRGGDRGQ